MFGLDKGGIVFNRLYYLRDRLERGLVRVREHHGAGHSLGPFTHTTCGESDSKGIVSLCRYNFGVDSAIIL